MDELHAQRRLLKSPPELWAEVSDEEALARHLGPFGQIRITRREAERTVAWEGDRASGVLWSRLVTPAMTVVLLAGAYLATDRDAWAEPWVTGTLVILFVLFGITGAFFGPQERRAAELAMRGGPVYDEVARRLRLGALVAALLVVAAVVLMVVKPG